jgi:monoamine oxidase
MPIDLLTLLTTAALFWLWTGTLALATAKSTEASSLCGATEVLIVGAGFAGLAAAKELQDNGLADFRIVEATNRIGGRVRSVQPPNFGGVWIEEGANWLETNNPIWDLAVKYKKDVTFSNLIDFSTFAYNPNDTVRNPNSQLTRHSVVRQRRPLYAFSLL